MRPTFMSSATTLANIPGTSSLRNCLSSTGWLSPASLAASCRKHTAGHCTKRQSHSGRRSWPGEMAQGDLAKGPWEPKLATSPGPLVGFVHCPRGNECLHNSFSGNTINDFKICKRWFREQVLRRAKRRVVCRRILSFWLSLLFCWLRLRPIPRPSTEIHRRGGRVHRGYRPPHIC
jgi:hypothetical protein